jgi:hypothetical protein
LNALGRQTVAALLNAAHPQVDYPFTPEQVISMFNNTFPGSNQQYNELKATFERANEQGCDLEKHDKIKHIIFWLLFLWHLLND